jgi:hypothetical protein
VEGEPAASSVAGTVAVCAACGTTCAIEGDDTVTVAAYRDLMRLTDADLARLRHARQPWTRRRA